MTTSFWYARHTMLSLQHLTVTRGSKVVLRDVSLDVEPTDTVCILGEEGAGKTTLLKLLTREVQPVEGVIKIDGAVLAQLPREVLRMYREKIGYLDETALLDESLTIAENVALPLDLRGTRIADRDRAVSDLLKRFHLTGVADRLPRNVSQGERRLAAIARTIAAGPLILVLDEPFQGLTHEKATLAANLLQNMQKRGTTIVVASADERTASLFKKARIARLHKNKLTEESAPTSGTSDVRMHEVAQAATATLVERSTTIVKPVDTEAPIEHAETMGKKKVRITAVGSL